MKNGKGKEYYENGKVAFKGEYLNDQRWNGKGYDIVHDNTYEWNKGEGLMKEYKNCEKS